MLRGALKRARLQGAHTHRARCVPCAGAGPGPGDLVAIASLAWD